MPTFYEFFAGGGMARSGLGQGWRCLFANDIDGKKGASYIQNWGDEELQIKDVADLKTADIPGLADLIWASFPCQDLSLAGNGAGLSGTRSGTFWPFWELVKGLKRENRRPNLVVLENVCGALTSHGGEDFRSLINALRSGGYRYGAIVIDAVRFVPQSRPRLFIVGVRNDLMVHHSLKCIKPELPFHTQGVQDAFLSLQPVAKASWLWWRLPVPTNVERKTFAELVQADVPWHSQTQTAALLALMLPAHRNKVEKAKQLNKIVFGTIYKRTRPDVFGVRSQRAEIRFDDIAGCLRTPGGGSSKQTILMVEGKSVRSRHLTPREAARLMGLDEEYILPQNANDAYHLTGDGLVVPVVRHLAINLLDPLVQNLRLSSEEAA